MKGNLRQYDNDFIHPDAHPSICQFLPAMARWQIPGASLGGKPWRQALGAGPGGRPWTQALDAGPGCRPWTRPGCKPWTQVLGRPWMQALEVGPGRRPWMQALDARLGCMPWSQALGAGPGRRPWASALDASPGRRPWAQSRRQALDASPGRRPWVQELDAGPGCRPWMQALDAGPECPFPSPVKVPHPPATVKNKFAVVGWGEAACPGSLSPRRGASPRWGGRAWEAYRPGNGRAFPPTGSVAPRVGVHPQEAKSVAGGKGPPLRRVTYVYPPCVLECHF